MVRDQPPLPRVDVCIGVGTWAAYWTRVNVYVGVGTWAAYWTLIAQRPHQGGRGGGEGRGGGRTFLSGLVDFFRPHAHALSCCRRKPRAPTSLTRIFTCLFLVYSIVPLPPGRPPGAANDGAQVKVFLYEMASIGMRARTAQRYVEAVSLQYKLQAAARNRLSVRVLAVCGAFRRHENYMRDCLP